MTLTDRVNDCIATTGSGTYTNSLLAELMDSYSNLLGDLEILNADMVKLKAENARLKKSRKAAK